MVGSRTFSSRFGRRCLPALIAAAAAFAAAGAPAAHAGEYTVIGCSDAAGNLRPTNGWQGYGGPNRTYCDASQGIYAETAGGNQSHLAGWIFSAPPDTAITAFRFWWYSHLSAGAGWAVPSVVFQARRGADWSTLTGAGNITPYPVDVGGYWTSLGTGSTGAILMGVRCDMAGPCTDGGEPYLIVRSTAVTLEDDARPVMPQLSGALVDDPYAHGTMQLDADSSDRGGGVYKFSATVGTTTVFDGIADSNSGRCAVLTSGSRDVLDPAPCSLLAHRAIPVDTRRFEDGRYEVKVTAEDIAGNTDSRNKTITIDNLPPALGKVAITGTPTEDRILTAETSGLSGQSPTLAYAWQRCDSLSAKCTDISDATDRTYSPVSADVGLRLRVRITATDGGGTTTVLSALTEEISAAGTAGDPTAVDPAGLGGGRLVESSPTPAKETANGLGATQDGPLSAAFEVNGRRTITIHWGDKRRVIGTLLRPDGKPIVGARLDVTSTAQTVGASATSLGQVSTDAKGRFLFPVMPGVSRTITFSYRHIVELPMSERTSTVTVQVIPSVKLKTNRRAVHNGRTIRFSGSVVGAPRGLHKVIDLQAYIGDGEWLTFGSTRLTDGGHFSYRYRFGGTYRTTTYRFRALVRTESGWPFATGRSNSAKVRVRP